MTAFVLSIKNTILGKPEWLGYIQKLSLFQQQMFGQAEPECVFPSVPSIESCDIATIGEIPKKTRKRSSPAEAKENASTKKAKKPKKTVAAASAGPKRCNSCKQVLSKSSLIRLKELAAERSAKMSENKKAKQAAKTVVIKEEPEIINEDVAAEPESV